MVANDKKETLKKVISLQRKLHRTDSRVEKLEVRVETLEKMNDIDHKNFKNDISELDERKANRDDLESTSGKVDKVNRIVSWAVYTIIGLFLTTVISGLIRLAWNNGQF